MAFEVLVQLIAGTLSVVAGGFASSEAIRRLFSRLFKTKEPPKSYAERLSELTANLTAASADVDAVLAELSQVARDREQTVTQLGTSLVEMERKEQEIREKIQVLEKVPLPVAEHFARLVAPSEKRSALRDYLLFVSGVVITTVIAVLIQVLYR